MRKNLSIAEIIKLVEAGKIRELVSDPRPLEKKRSGSLYTQAADSLRAATRLAKKEAVSELTRSELEYFCRWLARTHQEGDYEEVNLTAFIAAIWELYFTPDRGQTEGKECAANAH